MEMSDGTVIRCSTRAGAPWARAVRAGWGVGSAMCSACAVGSLAAVSRRAGSSLRARADKIPAHAQRPSRCARIASATGPAVEVRSTCGPSRTALAPASVRRRELDLADPALGADDDQALPRGRQRDVRDRRRRLLVQDERDTAGVDDRPDAFGETTPVERRARPRAPGRGATAWPPTRTVPSQRDRLLAARSPRQTTIDRSACHGTTASTPTSVAASIAISSRSPLARACTSTSGTAGAASTTTSVTATTHAVAGHRLDDADEADPVAVDDVDAAHRVHVAGRRPACRPSVPPSR